jgi:NAD(P)-dependent dehydrogenase (short-subunit alcohol dehydrogenase family)
VKVIRGKKALVTGAASGIGRGIALALAREGADLYLLDVDETGLATLVAEAEQLGVRAIGARCDLSQPADITRALRQMLDQWQTIEILVNNAGVAYYGPTHSMTGPQWDWLLGINLLAPIQITRELLPTLLSCQQAHILNVCSISGLVAGGRFAAYHTSKFGLIGFTEAVRAEYGRRGLGVSALCPGPVLTNLYKSCAAAKTDKAVPEPPQWLCCSVDAVSRAAIRCIYRNKRMKLVGPLAHLLAWSKWLAPGFLDFLNHASRKRRAENPKQSPKREIRMPNFEIRNKAQSGKFES